MPISEADKRLGKILKGYKKEMTEDLCRLLRYPSVIQEPKPGAPFGADIAAALGFMLGLAQNWGFETQNLEGYVGIADYGSQEEQVGILCHIDVVPAGKGWLQEPFGGDLKRGMIFGRGAIDNKGPMIACFYAMRALKDSGLPLKKRLRHIIGTDEESGFRCMEYFVKHHQPPAYGFVPDANFPVIYGEKGIIHFCMAGALPQEKGSLELKELQGGVASNVIPDEAEALLACNPQKQEEILELLAQSPGQGYLEGEITPAGLRLKALGRCCHASLPYQGINAISILLGFLKELPFAPGLKALLEKFSALACEDSQGQGLNIELEDESGPTTLAPTMIQLTPGRLEMEIDIRYPITYHNEEMQERISKTVTAAGLEISQWQAKNPHYVDPASPLVTTLLAQYRKYTKDAAPPIAIGGGTYARAMKNFVAFGPILPGQPQLSHEADEYIRVDHLLLLSKIYASALYYLAK